MTAEPVSVGLRKQLLVDDWVVAEKSGVTRSWAGWRSKTEGSRSSRGTYGTVLHDEGKFKLWYRGNPYGYAESADGLHFNKISLLKDSIPRITTPPRFTLTRMRRIRRIATKSATPTCARTRPCWDTPPMASTGTPTTTASR